VHCQKYKPTCNEVHRQQSEGAAFPDKSNPVESRKNLEQAKSRDRECVIAPKLVHWQLACKMGQYNRAVPHQHCQAEGRKQTDERMDSRGRRLMWQQVDESCSPTLENRRVVGNFYQFNLFM